MRNLFTAILLILFCAISAPAGAALDKTEQGFFYGHVGGITDQMVEESGTWGFVCNAYTAGFCISNTASGELRLNEGLYTMPDDFVIGFEYHGSTLSATDQIITFKYRWTSPTDYYAVVIHWVNASATIELKEFDSSGCSAGCDLDTDHTWTPANSLERYEFQVVVKGTSHKVYLNEVTVGSAGKPGSMATFANQDDFIELGTAILTATDATWTEGQFRIETDLTSSTVFIGGLRVLTDTDIVVNGLTTGQHALFCQAPEIRQTFGSLASGVKYVQMFSDASPLRVGQEFHFLEGVDLSEVVYFIRAVGSPTGSVVLKIYDDSSGPNSVVATSDEVTVASMSTTTSPFDTPEEVVFTFSTPFTLTADVIYYAIIEAGTGFTAATPNDYLAVTMNDQNGAKAIGSRYHYTGSWVETSDEDMTYVMRAEEKMRASAAESSGTATLDMSDKLLSLDGKIKIATSATDCDTDLVDATPRMITHTGGDVWTYTSGKLLTAGPVLGCPLDGDFKIWMRGSGYVGGTQVGKIQYTTGTLPGSAAGCTGACSNTSTVNLTATTDWTGSVDLASLTADTFFNYHVVIDDAIQAGSASFFMTPPANSTEVNYSYGAASCFAIKNKPFSHLDNIDTTGSKMFWSLGDNIYADFPEYFYSSITEQGYWDKHRDTVMELVFAEMSNHVFQCKVFDDHEFKNDYYGSVGTGLSGSVIRDWSFIDTNARSGIDDYETPSMPDPIRAGTHYYEARWGRSAFVAIDAISDKDEASDEDVGYYVSSANNPSLTNPGFETGDLTGWDCKETGGTACSFAGAVATAYEGSFGASFSEEFTTSVLEQAVTVSTTTGYEVSVLVQGDSLLRVRTDSNEAGSNICTKAAQAVSGVWQYLSCEIPDTNTDTSLYIQVKNNLVDTAMFADNVRIYLTGERHPSCTPDGTFADRINCSGTTFTAESPAISTTNGIIIYEDRMYGVTTVNSDTQLTLHDDINCTTCGAQRTAIWKDGKQILGRQQMLDVADTFKTLDDDATVDFITLVTSKPVNYLEIGTDHDGWAAYTYQRDFLWGYIKDNITTQPISLSGDRHITRITNDTWLDPNGHWEFMVANGAGPNSGPMLTIPDPDEVTAQFAHRHAIGIVSIDTSTASDADPKAAADFEIRDFTGNIVHTETGDNIEHVTDIVADIDVATNQNVQRVHRGSDGRCYAMIYNGTVFELFISDTDCQNFAADDLDLSAMGFDRRGSSPAMYLHEGAAEKLYFIYDKAADTGDQYIRTATITSGVPSWNVDETNHGGSAANAYNNRQILVADDDVGWWTAPLYSVASDRDSIRINRFTCGDECVTTDDNKGSGTQAAGVYIAGLHSAPLESGSGEIIHVYVKDYANTNNLEARECTPTTCAAAIDLGEIFTPAGMTEDSLTYGWQPQIASDGSGGAGLVYKSATWPYSMMFRLYDGASWGSAIEIGNADNKTQTSPAISRAGSNFYIAWLEGGATEVKLIKTDDLIPTSAGEFNEVSTAPADGYAKTKLTMSQSNDGESVLLYWQRVFGINQTDFGQFVNFRQLISGGGSPLPIFMQIF